MNKTLMLLSAASLAFVATACAEKTEETVTTEAVTPDLNDDGTVVTTETVPAE